MNPLYLAGCLLLTIIFAILFSIFEFPAFLYLCVLCFGILIVDGLIRFAYVFLVRPFNWLKSKLKKK
jgi:hypothetical protein